MSNTSISTNTLLRVPKENLTRSPKRRHRWSLSNTCISFQHPFSNTLPRPHPPSSSSTSMTTDTGDSSSSQPPPPSSVVYTYQSPPIVVHAVPVQVLPPPPQDTRNTSRTVFYGEVYEGDEIEPYFGPLSCLFSGFLLLFCCPLFWIPVVCPVDVRGARTTRWNSPDVVVVTRQQHETMGTGAATPPPPPPPPPQQDHQQQQQKQQQSGAKRGGCCSAGGGEEGAVV